LYGDATGTVRARKMERAPDASRPFRSLAGGLPPEHDPMAHVRHTFLHALHDLCGHLLLSAQAIGGVPLGTLRLDGTTIPADASKSRALRYTRRRALDRHLRPAVDTLCARTEQAEQTARPAGLGSADAIALRPERLAHVAQATAG
jgi:hypothetical protein